MPIAPGAARKRRGAGRVGSIAPLVRQRPQGNFVVAGPNAVPLAKKLAAGRAGGKDQLAQGSVPDFGTPDAKTAVEKLRKLLAS